ncbi:MAG: ATP-binding protein [Treponema sp.]|jgi:predicted AAA+ superfamily ATPase|nr:ATP-binding protein [Treponema sp.]
MDIVQVSRTVLIDLAALKVFSGLKQHPLLGALRDLLEALPGESSALVGRWSSFMSLFVKYNRNYSFYDTMAELVLRDENPFTLRAEQAGASGVDSVLLVLSGNDLVRLGRIAALDLSELAACVARRLEAVDGEAKLTDAEAAVLRAAEGNAGSGAGAFFVRGSRWGEGLREFAGYIRDNGAGLLGVYPSFRWNLKEGGLRPVANPDPVVQADLYGYEAQRSVVVSNTFKFLEGRPANNLLLYGDRGTGKSATIKAVCGEYAGRGLRLLEVRKEDLSELPVIMETLGRRAPRFVVFIDDLAFEAVDASFTALKALLEGGVERRPPNAVIYATSNRRHLVKERHSDRAVNDDVRDFDTMQEQLSLSDRFGLTVVFSSPTQEEYLEIAEYIAVRRGILSGGASPAAEASRRLYRENALRWERWFNGRSPRTAVQYADWAAGGEAFPWE